MATVKTTQNKTEKQSRVVETKSNATDQAAMASRYEEALKQLAEMAAAMKEAGIKLEAPPKEVTTITDDPTPEVFVGLTDPSFDPSRLTPQQIANLKPGVERPWSRADLTHDPDKYDFVPQFIPGAVHPILDEHRRPKIWLQVNGLGCCLTVGVLNQNISGIFYHAYKNLEQQWLESEDFKAHGPVNGPWVTGGPGGINTWYYEPEAPKAWIDLDGKYYQPGAPMPSTEGSETV
jgi:hypothetical protein